MDMQASLGSAVLSIYYFLHSEVPKSANVKKMQIQKLPNHT